MIEAAPDRVMDALNRVPDWPLRLAQQAFAGVLDATAFTDPADQTIAALHALNALHTRDRASLEQWLALQVATAITIHACKALAALARVDAVLAAAVRARLADARFEFKRLNPRKRVIMGPSSGWAAMRHDAAIHLL